MKQNCCIYNLLLFVCLFGLLLTIPLSSKKSLYDQSFYLDTAQANHVKLQRFCLALAIYHEARSDTLDGQVAVGLVIRNRVESSRYPNTFCSVVFDPRQFGFTERKSLVVDDLKAWTQADTIASGIMLGEPDFSRGAIFYHTISTDPYWNQDLVETYRSKYHIFYRVK